MITPAAQAQLLTRLGRRRRRGKVVPPVVRPVTLKPFPITTEYRERGSLWSLGYHTGEDHACPVGSFVLAVSWGEVVYVTGQTGGTVASWGVDYGIHVVIRLATGTYDYMSAHLSATFVRPGDRVKPGQVIGLSGMTGHASGPHVHFEARPAGGRFGSDVSPRLVKQMKTPAKV